MLVTVYPAIPVQSHHTLTLIELLFSVATATRDEIQSQKWFCTAFYGASMDETTETVASNLSPEKTGR